VRVLWGAEHETPSTDPSLTLFMEQTKVWSAILESVTILAIWAF